MLSNYWWPGNIRELENLIERLVAVDRHEWITDEDLPFEFHFAELDRTSADTNLLDRALMHLRTQLHPARTRAERLERDATARYLGCRSAR